MTKGELFKLEKEVDELCKTIELCGSGDDDVLSACENRLLEIEGYLEREFTVTKSKELSLKLVK